MEDRIERIIEDAEHPPWRWGWGHPHHHHHDARRVVMAVTLNPGQSVDIKATAQFPDPASPDPANPNFLTDPNATIFGQESVGGAVGTGTVVSITEGPTVAGVATITVTYVAAGDADIQAFASDPSGHVTPLSDPDTITCVAAAPSTDATRVILTDGVPTP